MMLNILLRMYAMTKIGFDDGYYANYPVMKKKSVSYAASFGDSHFNEESYKILNNRLKNFLAIGLRENSMLSYVKNHTDVSVMRTIDPTLLLTSKDYEMIACTRLIKNKYILLYSRRYNSQMEAYAEKLAAQNGMEIVEISLKAENASKHKMYYEAGVEEFLSLVKYADYVVTNSFHGLVFSVQYMRPFAVFSRELCNTKISELLELFGLSERLLVTDTEILSDEIDYGKVFDRITEARKKSLDFLKMSLDLL